MVKFKVFLRLVPVYLPELWVYQSLRLLAFVFNSPIYSGYMLNQNAESLSLIMHSPCIWYIFMVKYRSLDHIGSVLFIIFNNIF